MDLLAGQGAVQKTVTEPERTEITMDSEGIILDCHEGTWRTIGSREVNGEIFYLMESQEYGDTVANVLLDKEGNPVAEDLWNGVDYGAMQAIREYFDQHQTAYSLLDFPLQERYSIDTAVDGPGSGAFLIMDNVTGYPVRENGEVRTYADRSRLTDAVAEMNRANRDIYHESADYAREHGQLEAYRASMQENRACKQGIESVIRENFDGMHLPPGVLKPVVDRFGEERVAYVLANTVQQKSYDGRFSRINKEWAASIPVREDMGGFGDDRRSSFVVDSHPAVLDGFIDLAREHFTELEKAQEMEKSEPFIARYYVVNDAYGVKAEREYQYFADMEDAISAYSSLPNHLDKQLGMESAEQPPSQMSLISCQNGIETVEDVTAASLSGKWVNPESREAMRRAGEYLENHETEIAYHMESAGRYFTIETVSEGYDYTFYDSHFREQDGDVYDNPDVAIQAAMEDILEDEGLSLASCKVMDYEALQARIEQAERDRPLTPESVAQLKGRSHAYDAGAREAVYEFDCLVDGKPAVLTYTAGRREHFYSPLSDRGEMEDVFSIHTDGEDIWDRMPEPELLKLEKSLAGEAEAFLVEESIAKAASVYDLKEVDYDLMERENTSMTRDQKERIWDAMSGKGTSLIESAIANARNGEELQSVREALEEAQGIIGDEPYKALLETAGKKETELGAAMSIPLTPETEKTPSIRFYAAECMEFPVLGEYHEAETFAEAAKIYEAIPGERMNGIKGIGFNLDDGSDYAGSYPLVEGGKVVTEMIGLVPYYRDHPLVQEAVEEAKQYYPADIRETDYQPRESQETAPVVEEKPSEVPTPAVEKKEASERPARPTEKASDGRTGGRKESVLKALRERQAQIKERENQAPEQKNKSRKKGEQSL